MKTTDSGVVPPSFEALPKLALEGRFWGKNEAIDVARKLKRMCDEKVVMPQFKDQAVMCLATIYFMACKQLMAEAKFARFPPMGLKRRVRGFCYFLQACNTLRKYKPRARQNGLSFIRLALACSLCLWVRLNKRAQRYYEQISHCTTRLTPEQELWCRILAIEISIATRKYSAACTICRHTAEQSVLKNNNLEIVIGFLYLCARLDRELVRNKREDLRNHMTRTAWGLGDDAARTVGFEYFHNLFKALIWK